MATIKHKTNEDMATGTVATVTTDTQTDTPITHLDKKKKIETRKGLDDVKENESNYYEKIEKLTKEYSDVYYVALEEDGTVTIEVESKDSAYSLQDRIDTLDEIESVEIDVIFNDNVDDVEDDEEDDEEDSEDEYISPEDINDEDVCCYVLYCYPMIDYAIFNAEFVSSELEESRYDDSKLFEDSKALVEVRRQWKVNAKGKKRLKMKCKPGFKWNGTACVKLAGSELSKKRIATRKMLRNKRAQGDKLKRRVLRLSRKARRYRKSYGLK